MQQLRIATCADRLCYDAVLEYLRSALEVTNDPDDGVPYLVVRNWLLTSLASRTRQTDELLLPSGEKGNDRKAMEQIVAHDSIVLRAALNKLGLGRMVATDGSFSFAHLDPPSSSTEILWVVRCRLASSLTPDDIQTLLSPLRKAGWRLCSKKAKKKRSRKRRHEDGAGQEQTPVAPAGAPTKSSPSSFASSLPVSVTSKKQRTRGSCVTFVASSERVLFL